MTVVFNVDRNIRQKDYSHIKNGEVLITKCFSTIQGEGPYAGQCAIFVRLAGCNLGNKKSCTFCDTDFNFSEGTIHSPTQILNYAEILRKDRQKLMVLTGGEPLLQQVIPLIEIFVKNGWIVQIETNGYFWNNELNTIMEDKWLRPNPVKIVVSPKVNARNEYPNLHSDLLYYSCCLKILVEDEPNSPYESIPEFAHVYAKTLNKPVYISPINRYLWEPKPNQDVVSFWEPTPLDMGVCARNTKYAAQLALNFGYRLSLQTHLLATLE